MSYQQVTEIKGTWGGKRVGAGRKLAPGTKALRKMRKYLEVTLLSDFKLMAHLALRPEEFDDQVQFAGQEDDGLDKDGKPYTKRTGGYALDPLFKERLALLRFRLHKFLPDPPKEVDIQADVQSTSLVNIYHLMRDFSTSSIQSSISQAPEKVLETQGTTLPSKKNLSEIAGLLKSSTDTQG